MSKIKRQGGFTLIELMIIVIIIGMLAALAIPYFLDVSYIRAEASKVLLDINSAEVKHWKANHCYTADSVAIAGHGVTWPTDSRWQYEIKLDDSLGYRAFAICDGDTVATTDARGVVKYR